MLTLHNNINKQSTKVNKTLLSELPYFNFSDLISAHGQFNNTLSSSLPTKKYLDRLPSYYDLDLFTLNTFLDRSSDSNTYYSNIRCKYFSPHSFCDQKSKIATNPCPDSNISFLHTNIRSLKRNLENFQTHLLDELDFHFSIIGVTETRINSSTENLDFNPSILHYNFEYLPTPLSAGGVGMYIDERFQYQTIERCSNEAFQALFIELLLPKSANIICGVLYRQHNSPERFQEYFDSTMEKLSATGKQIILMGDFNINLLHVHTSTHAQNFMLSLQSLNLTPTIDKPTRVHNNSYSLIDNIFINSLESSICSGNIVSDLTDHFSQFCILNSSTFRDLYDHVKPKRLTRDFSNYSETKFLRELSEIDLLGTICNKTDINKSFSTFHNKLKKLLNKHAPLKPISKRRLRKQQKPWITKGIRRSIKIKNSLYYSGDIKTYKIDRNKILMLTRISKRNFFHNYFEDNLSNIKKTWEGINNLLGRKRKATNHITSLKRLGSDHISYNSSEFPDSIFPQLVIT